jgi:hypothetical protein
MNADCGGSEAQSPGCIEDILGFDLRLRTAFACDRNVSLRTLG